MSKIKEILSNKSTLSFILGVVLVLLFLRQCEQTNKIKRELQITQETSNRNFNNYLATTDSVSVYKNKNGDLISSIRSYEFDIVNLKGDQKEIIKKYQDVLSLNKDLNNVNTLISAELAIKDSLLATTNVVEIDSTTSQINYNRFDVFSKGNTRRLTGSSTVKFDSGKFYVIGESQFKIDQTFSLSAAIENIDGANRLKLSTTYPGLEISDIENINLINTKLNQQYKKKSGWSIGIGVGYGINLNNNQVISTGPSIGLGVYWSPKWLRF